MVRKETGRSPLQLIFSLGGDLIAFAITYISG